MVEEAVRLLATEGVQTRADTTYGADGSSMQTSLLVSAELGEYWIDHDGGTTPWLPSGVWRPPDGTGPTIVAAYSKVTVNYAPGDPDVVVSS